LYLFYLFKLIIIFVIFTKFFCAFFFPVKLKMNLKSLVKHEVCVCVWGGGFYYPNNIPSDVVFSEWFNPPHSGVMQTAKM